MGIKKKCRIYSFQGRADETRTTEHKLEVKGELSQETCGNAIKLALMAFYTVNSPGLQWHPQIFTGFILATRK